MRIPQLGRVQSFISSQGGWLVVIVIPAMIIIISDILKIFKLTGVKNKIEKIDEEDKRMKKERAKREELRKEDIRKRLKLDKNIYEPEPIITKKSTRIVVGAKALKVEMHDIEFEQPKILSRSERRAQNNYQSTNSKKRKKRKNRR